MKKQAFICALLLAAVSARAEIVSFAPAPGRADGRIYYYLPERLDRSKPVPLFVFLHGGSVDSPETAPERYFEKDGHMWPVIEEAPFIVAAPSAPLMPETSRWNKSGTVALIDAAIADAKRRYAIDPDRVFLGGHSMGGYGAYHLGCLMADRFAGIWMSSGAWWEADFRSLLGTPVYIQHGTFDCSPAEKYHPGSSEARHLGWCGTPFARAADELMRRDGVEHVYDEHGGGHSLRFPESQEAMRRFFAWTRDKRRDPYAKRAAVVTPCGTRHPVNESHYRTRWLELLAASSGPIEVDAIVLEGPNVARTEDEFRRQTHRLVKRTCPTGARIVAENLGGNRFRVSTENVRSFRIYLSPRMGDIEKPFAVEVNGTAHELKAEPISGEADYTAVLRFCATKVANEQKTGKKGKS